jgi:hypothetical protein
MDAKGAYPLGTAGAVTRSASSMITVDFVVGLAALPALRSDLVRAVLMRSFERYGVPTAMLMDHGSPWWSTQGPPADGARGLPAEARDPSDLRRRATSPDARQSRALSSHLGRALALDRRPHDTARLRRAFRLFVDEYNHVRRMRHSARATALHFEVSSRRSSAPRRWDYAPGLVVRRVAPIGQIHYEGRRYFVSEALKGEEVACIPFQDRVLVSYRHMYVRELHPRTDKVFRDAAVDEPWPAANAALMCYYVLKTSTRFLMCCRPTLKPASPVAREFLTVEFTNPESGPAPICWPAACPMRCCAPV